MRSYANKNVFRAEERVLFHIWIVVAMFERIIQPAHYQRANRSHDGDLQAFLFSALQAALHGLSHGEIRVAGDAHGPVIE
jgi:hypothetical protein